MATGIFRQDQGGAGEVAHSESRGSIRKVAEEAEIARRLQHLQGLLDRGEWQAAESQCWELTALAPDREEAWLCLGTIALYSGRLPMAEAAFRKLISLRSDFAPYWHNLSLALREQGKAADAESSARQALARDDSQPEFWLTYGDALYYQSKWNEAADAYRRCLERNANLSTAWCNLGATEERLQRPAAAAEAYERSLLLAPNDIVVLSNFARVLAQGGDMARARELLQRLKTQQPQSASAWSAIGSALKLCGDVAQAEAAYRNALAMSPEHREARFNLAYLLFVQGAMTEAEACVRPLLDDHGNAEAWSLLGMLQLSGRQDEGVAALRRSIEIEPHPDRHSMLLFALNYAPDANPVGLRVAHQAWDAAHGRPVAVADSGRHLADLQRPLRLGFVSADFGRHPTGFMVLPVLEHLDKRECSVVCYSDRHADDELTPRFRAAANIWRPVAGLSHDALAEQIAHDEIDVLVDLMGHAGKRLQAFALRPAPLQITWFGYVGTTGMASIDFLLADRFHIRPGEEPLYVEKILRMPGGYACYEPYDGAPQVEALPAQANGFVTFGCLNSPAKFSPGSIALWSEILQRVPAARLLLKYGGLEEAALQALFRGKFEQHGVAGHRIQFAGKTSLREHLSAYGRVDLALDTQPYSGGLTTCEALWMGVPVVTCPGKTFAGRHSVSHLTNAGFPQFIAADAKGYVELAVQWANRLDELAAMRRNMREQVRQSPLCNAPRVARDFLAVIRQAWETQKSWQGRA